MREWWGSEKMQINNTNLLEALKHTGQPDAESVKVSKGLKDREHYMETNIML